MRETLTDDPFADDEPPSDRSILKDLWHTMRRVERQVEKTNGRVASLEKFRYATIGGLSVVTAVVVPLFIGAVQ